MSRSIKCGIIFAKQPLRYKKQTRKGLIPFEPVMTNSGTLFRLKSDSIIYYKPGRGYIAEMLTRPLIFSRHLFQYQESSYYTYQSYRHSEGRRYETCRQESYQ